MDKPSQRWPPVDIHNAWTWPRQTRLMLFCSFCKPICQRVFSGLRSKNIQQTQWLSAVPGKWQAVLWPKRVCNRLETEYPQWLCVLVHCWHLGRASGEGKGERKEEISYLSKSRLVNLTLRTLLSTSKLKYDEPRKCSYKCSISPQPGISQKTCQMHIPQGYWRVYTRISSGKRQLHTTLCNGSSLAHLTNSFDQRKIGFCYFTFTPLTFSYLLSW